MNEYKTSAELKQDARDMLRGRWKDAVLMNLLPTLIVMVVMSIAIIAIIVAIRALGNTPGTGTIPSWDSAGDGNRGGSGNGGSTVIGIFSTFITTGISFAFLNALRDPNFTFQPLKDAFQVFSRKYFLPVLLIYIISSIFTFLWALLFIIPGIIKSYAYSQAYLIYKDHTDGPNSEQISALDCITESKLLMYGHKMRYFLLQLSFLGWILLGVLTLGIGFLWISPYMTATNAAFYNDLVGGPSVDDGWEVEDEWDESII